MLQRGASSAMLRCWSTRAVGLSSSRYRCPAPNGLNAAVGSPCPTTRSLPKRPDPDPLPSGGR